MTAPYIAWNGALDARSDNSGKGMWGVVCFNFDPVSFDQYPDDPSPFPTTMPYPALVIPHRQITPPGYPFPVDDVWTFAHVWVDWGDGTVTDYSAAGSTDAAMHNPVDPITRRGRPGYESSNDAPFSTLFATHEYATPGTYTIELFATAHNLDDINGAPWHDGPADPDDWTVKQMIAAFPMVATATPMVGVDTRARSKYTLVAHDVNEGYLDGYIEHAYTASAPFTALRGAACAKTNMAGSLTLRDSLAQSPDAYFGVYSYLHAAAGDDIVAQFDRQTSGSTGAADSWLGPSPVHARLEKGTTATWSTPTGTWFAGSGGGSSIVAVRQVAGSYLIDGTLPSSEADDPQGPAFDLDGLFALNLTTGESMGRIPSPVLPGMSGNYVFGRNPITGLNEEHYVASRPVPVFQISEDEIAYRDRATSDGHLWSVNLATGALRYLCSTADMLVNNDGTWRWEHNYFAPSSSDDRRLHPVAGGGFIRTVVRSVAVDGLSREMPHLLGVTAAGKPMGPPIPLVHQRATSSGVFSWPNNCPDNWHFNSRAVLAMTVGDPDQQYAYVVVQGYPYAQYAPSWNGSSYDYPMSPTGSNGNWVLFMVAVYRIDLTSGVWTRVLWLRHPQALWEPTPDQQPAYNQGYSYKRHLYPSGAFWSDVPVGTAQLAPQWPEGVEPPPTYSYVLKVRVNGAWRVVGAGGSGVGRLKIRVPAEAVT